jgi:hypothetical protein
MSVLYRYWFTFTVGVISEYAPPHAESTIMFLLPVVTEILEIGMCYLPTASGCLI